jgi:hypothetical protein
MQHIKFRIGILKSQVFLKICFTAVKNNSPINLTTFDVNFRGLIKIGGPAASDRR